MYFLFRMYDKVIIRELISKDDVKAYDKGIVDNKITELMGMLPKIIATRLKEDKDIMPLILTPKPKTVEIMLLQAERKVLLGALVKIIDQP